MTHIRRLYRLFRIRYELLELRIVIWALRRRDTDIPWMLIVILTASLFVTASWGYFRGINQYEAGMEAGRTETLEMVRNALLDADKIKPVAIKGTGIELLLWSKGAVIDVRERAEKFKMIKVAQANGQ